MDPSFYPLASAGGYGEARLDILANNLANANTPGYKADQLRFSEILDTTQTAPHIAAEQFVEFKPGLLEQTGNTLDVAIQGDGFFVVDTPDGERFTRDGSFRMGVDGTLVTKDGHPVLGSAGPIAIDLDAREIKIDGGGRVFVDGQQVNSIQVVAFDPNNPPLKVGGNLFYGENQTPAAEPAVLQRALERSNVSPIVEMSRMIEIMRGYEAYQKLVQTLDQTASQTNQVGTV